MGAVPSRPDLRPCIPASAPQIWSSVPQQQPSQTSPTTTTDSPLQTLPTSSAPNLCPSETDHSPSHWSGPPLPKIGKSWFAKIEELKREILGSNGD